MDWVEKVWPHQRSGKNNKFCFGENQGVSSTTNKEEVKFVWQISYTPVYSASLGSYKVYVAFVTLSKL